MFVETVWRLGTSGRALTLTSVEAAPAETAVAVLVSDWLAAAVRVVSGSGRTGSAVDLTAVV